MVDTTQVREDLASEASLAELVRQLSEQTSRLARQELELAKAELAEKGKRAGIGAGMFGGAGIFGVYALGALVAAAILGLATAVAPWLAALIVTAALGAIAGVILSAAVSKVLSSFLFGLSAHDSIAFAGASAFLVGVAGVASLLPARRAMRAGASVPRRA